MNDTKNKKAAETRIARSHFLPDPLSSPSATLDFSTQLSFQFIAISTNTICWKIMKKIAPTLAKFICTVKNKGSFGTKHMAATKKTKRTYFAGQASRFAVFLQHTAIPAKKKKIMALNELRYTPAFPAHLSMSWVVANVSHPSIQAFDTTLSTGALKFTMAGATAYCKQNAITIANISSRTDRFRPDATPGATVEGLSLPQQDDSKEPAALQKHQTVPSIKCVQVR